VVSIQRPGPDDFVYGDEIRIWRTVHTTVDPAHIDAVILTQELDGVWALGPDREVAWHRWDADVGPVVTRVIRRHLSNDGKLSQTLEAQESRLAEAVEDLARAVNRHDPSVDEDLKRTLDDIMFSLREIAGVRK
jgi:hypothetical protein